jgi:chromosome segregation ATPase
MEYKFKAMLSVLFFAIAIGIAILFFVVTFKVTMKESREKRQFKKDFADLKYKVDLLSTPLTEKTDVTKNDDNKMVFKSVNENISFLTANIKNVSDSVNTLKAELNVKSTELQANIQNTKDELIKRSDETENAVKKVNILIDNTVIQLNSLKKVTDEDRAKIIEVVKDLQTVKSKFKELQDKIDDLKLLFPDYDFLIKIRKFELEQDKKDIK